MSHPKVKEIANEEHLRIFFKREKSMSDASIDEAFK
jgi:hypothetical protein